MVASSELQGKRPPAPLFTGFAEWRMFGHAAPLPMDSAVALGNRVAWLNDRPPGSQMARASSANAAGSR